MTNDRYGRSDFIRATLAPGLLGAIVLLAGLALVGGSWFIGVQYAASILAIILCIMAWQAKYYWWLIGLVPIAVLWNPVVPFTLDSLWWRLGAIVGAAVFAIAALSIKTPAPQENGGRSRGAKR